MDDSILENATNQASTVQIHSNTCNLHIQSEARRVTSIAWIAEVVNVASLRYQPRIPKWRAVTVIVSRK
jgi:hypothetical protein